MHATTLSAHPSTPETALTDITVEVEPIGADLLTLRYSVSGDIDRIRLPAQAGSAPREGLWEHTCLEVFLGIPGSERYIEGNFSPSSEWAVFGFSGYRKEKTLLQLSKPPRIHCRRREGTLDVDVDLHLDAIRELDGIRGFQLALSAVIENIDGRKSYWALAHPPGKPDFHHIDSFALAVVVGDSP